MDANVHEPIRPLKPATTFEEQLALLEGRGLVIDDSDALAYLSKINYYRFSAYLLPFKDGDSYIPGTSFHTVRQLHEFDRRMRVLILSALEPIEVKLRTKVAYHHAHKYGPIGYLDRNFASNPTYHEEFEREFQASVRKQSKNLFVQHHNRYYGGLFPIWVACELFSFGLLSRFYANLRPEDQASIAREMQCSPYYLGSWLHSLTELRNRCAHYARLYYLQLKVRPRLPKGIHNGPKNYVFDDLCVLSRLYGDEQERWKREFVLPLQALVEYFRQDICLEHIGFPPDWIKVLRLGGGNNPGMS